jgi:glycosyltransferase involved in cell wall biosynthesis
MRETARSMRIVIVYPFDPFPWEAKRPMRYTMLSTELARRGHQVTWISADFRHQTKAYRPGPAQRTVDGIDYRLIHVPSYKLNISLRRLWSHRVYARRAGRLLRRLHAETPIDLVLASNPPIESVRTAMQFCAEAGLPGLVDVRDAWPKVLEAAFPPAVRGPLSRVLLAPLRRDLRLAANLVSGAVACSQEYLNYFLSFRQNPMDIPQAVFLLGFGVADVHLPEKRVPKDPREPLTVVYLGKFGRFYDLETVVYAAQALAPRGIRFICIGDGPTRSRITHLARGLGLENIEFPGYVPFEEAYPTLFSSDVGLVPYRLEYPPSIPNKPFNYLFCGLALVSSLSGSFSQMLQREQFGLEYQAEDPASLVEALLKMDTDRDMVYAMGKRGAAFARRYLDGRQIYRQYADWIEDMVRSKAGIS